MSKRKIKKAMQLSPIGKFGRTWEAVISHIPESLIEALTVKQIVTLIGCMQNAYGRGAVHEIKEFAQHHEIKGCPWGAELKQITIKEND